MLEESGIQHIRTAPYNPMSNGIAERMNRTLINTVRVLLAQASLCNELWGEALLHATYLQNRVASRALNGRTPFEALFGTIPHMRGVKVFGCLAYAHIPKEKSNKLDPRAKSMILVGGPHGQTYRVFDPDKHVLHRVRHVRFNETVFPGFRVDESGENNDEAELFVENDDAASQNSEAGTDNDSGYLSALEKLFNEATTDNEQEGDTPDELPEEIDHEEPAEPDEPNEQAEEHDESRGRYPSRTRTF
jgi:hypothetical protein